MHCDTPAVTVPSHRVRLWQLVELIEVTAAPQSPAALGTGQKGSAGKVLAHGHIPYKLPTCQEEEGGGPRGGRNVAEGTLEGWCKPQHRQHLSISVIQ